MRTELFPEIEPHDSGMLAVGDGHTLYWEESGRPDGTPVLFLHGGPGAGTMSVHRRFFDPAHFRIVLFDQRGAGRSTPPASIADNTTAHLVADIEALRAARGIARWHLFGGSWGSTLALAYAQAHPDRCLGMVMRGIFTCGAREVDWFVEGMGRFFPEAARAFREALPEAERGDLLAAYARRLNDPDPEVHLPAAQAWATYEARCSTLKPSPDAIAALSDGRGTLALARIEAHYLANGAFVEPGALIAGVDRIRHLPATIVQGRYDMVCPIETADAIAQAWPEATYDVIPDAGHSALEPGTRIALLRAVERLKQPS